MKEEGREAGIGAGSGEKRGGREENEKRMRRAAGEKRTRKAAGEKRTRKERLGPAVLLVLCVSIMCTYIVELLKL